MKRSIVFKLFAVTALLCVCLLVVIGAVQQFFFKDFYIRSKIEALKTQIHQLSEHGAPTRQELQALYESSHVWAAVLDANGSIIGSEDYSITVLLEKTQEQLTIPLYPYTSPYYFGETLLLHEGERLMIDMVIVNGCSLPYLFQELDGSLSFINTPLAFRLNGANADPDYASLKTEANIGTIMAVRLPERIEALAYPYQEMFFLEQINLFQAELLRPDGETQNIAREYTIMDGDVAYQLVAQPLEDMGETRYLLAMASLQPVDEAVLALTKFYPALAVLALVLVALASLMFSRLLAKPLLAMNRVTEKIARRDFSEVLPVPSSDELGQLSGNINRLSEELEDYIDRLQEDLDREKQLEAVRKSFISGVSHELKTPLAVMKSCLSILRDGIAADKTEHYFEAMESEVTRMDNLVMEMLDLAKMSSGTYKPPMVSFDIGSTVRRVCADYCDEMDDKGIYLKECIESAVVTGHEALIYRVLSNFLSNAIRHTEEGHTITVSVAQENAAVQISVENEGQPLAEEDLTRVWEQFYRAGGSPAAGTGLGLAIAKEILLLHQALYGVENTKNGVRFYFSL